MHPIETRIPNELGGDRRFELLVNAVKDYAIYLLDREGYIASWNAGAERFKGYKADEIIGQHFSKFYTEEDRADGLPQRALATAAEFGTFEAEGWRVRKDGTRFWTSVVIDPVIDDEGILIGFAKVTRDLTERWQAQQETERAKEALAQAQKMEAMGRLTGGVAHDFNNLLTVIRASADLLKLPNLSEEKRQRYIDAVADAADRAGSRIEGMRQIIETSVGSPVLVSLEALTSAAVNADVNQFETALLNLVVNARDAMPAGGQITITTRILEGVPAVRRHAAAKGSFVAVEVEDSGSGIGEDVLQHIFEPFFTTKGLNKGTGLGLSQVHGFAKQSGGEVDVRSEIGTGTKFTLYLPLAQAEQVESASRQAASREQITTRRILLVEDNEVVGQFARGLLEELGQVVTWVENGKAAMDVLETSAAKFDLIFSDVIMPGMNGLELAREIAGRWPQLAIVLTSGYSHVLAEESGHGFELLRKPYSMEALMTILGRGT
jgi:PAS domain S-box-containing protein